MAKRRKARAKKYTCGNCQRALGKGSRKQPSIWCNVCGWVHYKCSGLTTVTEYAKYRGENFLCSKCSRTRRLVPATQETIAYSKLHNIYTSCQSPASFGSRSSLKKESNCTFKQVDNFLRKSETYTKFKQARRNFTRLKVQSYRLNEIWSIDLADMQQLSEFNQGITFLFVAVDTLSRFVWVVPLKRKTAAACRQALIDVIEGNKRGPPVLKPRFCGGSRPVSPNPEKIWVDKGREFAREFANFCQQSGIHLYSTCSETKSVFAERNIRSIKAVIFKYLHENNTEVYHEQLQAFVDIINSRINRVTKLAPNHVKKSDESFLVSLQNCNAIKKPKFKLGQHVRIRRKIDLFHRGYRIQFTEEVFQIAAVETLNPPTYSLRDCNNQLIQGKFYESELVQFEKDNEQSTQ